MSENVVGEYEGYCCHGILLTRLQQSSNITLLSRFDWKGRSVSSENSCSIQGQRRLDHVGYAHTPIFAPHLI